MEMHLIMGRIQRAIFFFLPIIVIGLVFQAIDFVEFKKNIVKTDPLILMLGICYYPLIILTGAMRWKILLARFLDGRIQFPFVLNQYWIGLCIGFFTPSSLGWDGYRVIAVSRKFGQYALNTAIIFAEKLVTLVACVFMILALYPMVPLLVSHKIQRAVNISYVLAFVSVVIFILANFAMRNQMLSILLKRAESRFIRMLKGLGRRFGFKVKGDNSRFSLNGILKPFGAPKQLLTMFLFSLGIQLITATGNQVFFRALGYDLPFAVNLFISPIIFLLFVLPISFGGIGIREAAYILLYGLFGVPKEIALIVSFFSLSGMLFSNLLGGVLWLLSNARGAGTQKK